MMVTMARHFTEHRPHDVLQPRVECVWTAESVAAGTHRVLPDGCIDLMYSVQDGKSQLELIGAMTSFADVVAGPGHRIVAVRFRPAGLSGFAPCSEWTDRNIEWGSISPRDARWIKQQLDDAPSPETMLQIVEGIAARLPAPDAMQRAIGHLEAMHGQVDLSWLAAQANMSERQFRRVCHARTGLTPKQLARILRFRHAHALCTAQPELPLTEVALASGYFDQAHFNHDFREWAGLAPSEVRMRSARPK